MNGIGENACSVLNWSYWGDTPNGKTQLQSLSCRGLEEEGKLLSRKWQRCKLVGRKKTLYRQARGTWERGKEGIG